MPVLGMVEFNSIAVGIHAGDAMVKAAPIDLLASHPIDPGKYLTVVTGDVASVEAAIAAGRAAGADDLLYSFVLPNAHDQIIHLLRHGPCETERNAVGVLETRSAASIVVAADAACKTAPVHLVTLHLALRIGGKGYAVLVGNIADIEASTSAGAQAAGPELIRDIVIPNPYEEAFAHLLHPGKDWAIE